MKNRISNTIRMSNSAGEIVEVHLGDNAPVEQYASRTGRLYAKIKAGEMMYVNMFKHIAKECGFKPLAKGRGARHGRVGPFGSAGADLAPDDPNTEFVVVTLAG